MSTFWKACEVYFPMQLEPTSLGSPFGLPTNFSDDWSEGQESSRDRTLVQLPMQNCTILQRFEMHAAHVLKAYQVYFHTQQTARHFDFPLKRYDSISADWSGA